MTPRLILGKQDVFHFVGFMSCLPGLPEWSIGPGLVSMVFWSMYRGFFMGQGSEDYIYNVISNRKL